MIPTRIQVRDSRRLLIITYWINDFLRGNFTSRFVFFGVQSLLHSDLVSLFVLCWSGDFCNWILSTRLLEKQEDCQPRMHELYRAVREHVPPFFFFWKLDSRKRHILHSLDRTQLIHTCILLSFSQSLVIHDSRAEVQRFMIPKFLKQRFMILTCFVTMIHDSVSTLDRKTSLFWLYNLKTSLWKPSIGQWVTFYAAPDTAYVNHFFPRKFIAFDEGERLLFVYRTWCSNRSVCHTITLFGRHLGPAWHVLPRCHVFSFSRPGTGIYFVTLVGRWNVGDFLFTTGLFIVSQFSIKFFLYRKFFIPIIGFVDVMITMCSAHCICFYEFKQDQLRSTRFNSITNYWTSFRFYKIFTALYLLVFVTIFEKYTRSWTVKR